jgi:hypothetical protein
VDYSLAVKNIGSAVSRHRPEDLGRSLAEHLMTYYWRGSLGLEAGPVVAFFEEAGDELRSHAIDFIGRSLSKTDVALEPEIVKRLQDLWESRLEAAAGDIARSRKEVASFGWWFSTAKFDDDWALDHLEQTLRLVGTAEPDHYVVERLEEVAVTDPARAVECLRMFVEGDVEGWAIHSWRQHARGILERAMQSSEVKAQVAARKLINDLGALGQLSFRDVLS